MEHLKNNWFAYLGIIALVYIGYRWYKEIQKSKITVPHSFTVKGFVGPDTSDDYYSYENGKYYKSYSTIAGQQKSEIPGNEYMIAYKDALAANKLL